MMSKFKPEDIKCLQQTRSLFVKLQNESFEAPCKYIYETLFDTKVINNALKQYLIIGLQIVPLDKLQITFADFKQSEQLSWQELYTLLSQYNK